MRKSGLAVVLALAVGAIVLIPSETANAQKSPAKARSAAVPTLVGVVVRPMDADRYGREPRGGYPWGRNADQPGYVWSPWTNYRIDCRKIPRRGTLVLDPSARMVFRRP